MVKKIYLYMSVAYMAMAFSACKPNKTATGTKDEVQAQQTVMPGSDKDEHGCIGSAGYTWSELKKECVRPFEIGFKLSGMTDENKNFAAYAVFAADSSQAEIFIPEVKGGVILERASNGWGNGRYKLSCTDGKWYITQAGVAVFSGKQQDKK